MQKARTWQQTQVEYKSNWQQNVNKNTTQVKNVVTSPVRKSVSATICVSIVDKPDIMPDSA